MSAPVTLLLHATCVALGARGVLLRGPSGAGKSDLALRLVDRGAWLVADDQVELTVEAGTLVARCPAAIRGLLEVRGLGLVDMPATRSVPLALVADLVPPADVPRLPADERVSLADINLSRIALNPFEHSAPIKLEMALALACGSLEVKR
ncbi:HPr kinase/phosphorylase [Zavarzinia aquatilis]|uniref:Serine/threonine protein kinase n=1 Tax=Zavarzinia aquatilis TaxID=2211142 RepID=A0A317EG19_9PROT|nr:HPr kinase/phosphatase C-terminal domain-containing protein [Zavarzinia aquatilis]PWR25030.1 serine/threonine protein kinase [Zavarzinia aquatilis]